jgi:hypothetical protein
MLAGEGDDYVRWLDLKNQVEFHGARAHKEGRVVCAIHEQGKYAVMGSSSAYGQAVDIYDPTTGGLIASLEGVPAGGLGDVAIDSPNDLAFVTQVPSEQNPGQDSTVIIDLKTATVIDSLPIALGQHLALDPVLRRLIGFEYFVDLAEFGTTPTGIRELLMPGNPILPGWGDFGLDAAAHFTIMPWRYSTVVVSDLTTLSSRVVVTGGDLAQGACAGDGLGFVLDSVAPAVIAVDLLTGKLVARFASPPVPSDCGYDRDTKILYVLAASTGELFSINVGAALQSATSK